MFFVDNWSPSTASEIRYRVYNPETDVLGSLTTLDTFSGAIGYNEVLTAALGHDGTYHWIITKMRGNNLIRIWKLDNTGITGPFDKATTFMKASPDGKFLVMASGFAGTDNFWLWSFDNQTGNILTEHKETLPYNDPIGVDFSPNSRNIYVSYYGTAGTNVISKLRLYAYNYLGYSEVTVTSTATYQGAVQLGANKKIYIAQYLNSELLVINDPDADTDITAPDITTLNINTQGGVSKLGLPVVPQDAVADGIKDYRVFDGVQWRSVCAGDDIRYYDGSTWQLLQAGDRYYDQTLDEWVDIVCNLTYETIYFAAPLIGVQEPALPPFNTGAYTQILLENIAGAFLSVGQFIRIVDNGLLDGEWEVFQVQSVGADLQIIIDAAWSISYNTGGQGLIPTLL
jgi:hypothetical protein